MMLDSSAGENNSGNVPPDPPPPEATETHNLFAIRYHEGVDRINVELNPGFSMHDWDTFMGFVRNKIGKGVLNWDLDLRRITFLSSLLLGAMVTLNMVIRSQNGDLRLIVAKDSRVAQLLYLSRLNRIITLLEI